MKISDESIEARIAAAGELIDEPEIDMVDVGRRVVHRRRTQAAGLVTSFAVVIVATVGGIHLASTRTRAVHVAAPAVASRSANPGLGAGPACAPPDIDFSGRLETGSRTVSAARPLTYAASITDTQEASFLDGSLFLGKTGLGLQARLSNGDPAATRATNQQAQADLHKVASGQWAASLKVTSLPRGSYPLIFFGHYRYLSADCVARGGNETYSAFLPIGVVNVR